MCQPNPVNFQLRWTLHNYATIKLHGKNTSSSWIQTNDPLVLYVAIVQHLRPLIRFNNKGVSVFLGHDMKWLWRVKQGKRITSVYVSNYQPTSITT